MEDQRVVKNARQETWGVLKSSLDDMEGDIYR